MIFKSPTFSSHFILPHSKKGLGFVFLVCLLCFLAITATFEILGEYSAPWQQCWWYLVMTIAMAKLQKLSDNLATSLEGGGADILFFYNSIIYVPCFGAAELKLLGSGVFRTSIRIFNISKHLISALWIKVLKGGTKSIFSELRTGSRSQN